MHNFSLLIVDDEPLARTRIRKAIARLQDIDVVYEAATGMAGLDIVNTTHIDIILLDIKMPELDGIGFIEELQKLQIYPVIIFVTAFDEYAVKAYEFDAVDYLLKPVEFPRLEYSINRAITKLQQMADSEKVSELQAIIENLRKHQHSYNETLNSDFWIKDKEKVIRIGLNDIKWLEAERDYVRFHTSERSHLLRASLKSIEQKLPDYLFMRIHRSAIVNLGKIVGAQYEKNARLKLVLEGETSVNVGKSYKKKITSYLKSQNPQLTTG
jgi:DNA-binding LytR/AlgR family response regulator